MISTLEQILSDINYEDLGLWKMSEITHFCRDKNLWNYQTEALKNIIKVLKLYFENKNGKKKFLDKYLNKGVKIAGIKKFLNSKDRKKSAVNKRFDFFRNHFEVLEGVEDEYIPGENFLNRACFWMATGSGKSLVLIKTIEILDHLQKKELIPKKEIMLLLPRQDLISQFKREVSDFNSDREKKIELVSLKDYENDKQNQSLDFDDTIKVYFYRSDLLRDERKEAFLDYKNYQNDGNWYVFLDEAHRGEKENSLMQDYICVLSKNGFLFNFSATFSEEIDFATTCYNFNLMKFINEGYGKNLYLSNSYFSFSKDNDDFSEKDKQKQVLKSLIVFTLVKMQKQDNLYHNPLLMTFVNSVNTSDADLLLFFKKLEEIAVGSVENALFEQSKQELISDFLNNRRYFFSEEEFQLDAELVKKIEIKDVLLQVFNSRRHGKIELLEGEKGKEIVLKLQTAQSPFALIKIGEAERFRRQQLGNEYMQIIGFDEKKIFENINQDENINLLLGSRGFYEGWDSNRPNVINMINIGKKDAKKFVLQAIGRGIRVEPRKGVRKRLDYGDANKNVLLETLFIFATDKNSIKAIVETVNENQSRQEREISLWENDEKPFDLLIPVYKETEISPVFAKFNIASGTLEKFKEYCGGLDENLMLLKNKISVQKLNSTFEKIQNGSLFQVKSENVYSDMNFLFQQIIDLACTRQKIVDGVKRLDNEIIHFKHIKVFNLSDEETELLEDKIKKVKNFAPVDKAEEEFRKVLKLKKIVNHYYLPLIYSEDEKINYVSRIIYHPSEVKFIKNLDNFVAGVSKDKNVQWMFCKINENLDKICVPYFYAKDNSYRKFYPDFIFWIKNKSDYEIIFIDPKGTSHTDYESKVDDFEKLFFENDRPKVFIYKGMKITFKLQLIAEDKNAIGGKYKSYWLNEGDFSFLER